MKTKYKKLTNKEFVGDGGKKVNKEKKPKQKKGKKDKKSLERDSAKDVKKTTRYIKDGKRRKADALKSVVYLKTTSFGCLKYSFL